jgi:peptide/nickel transport system substrate-binding protein
MTTHQSELTIIQSLVEIGDPHRWSDNYNKLSILFNIYDTIVSHEEGNSYGSYTPAIARSWSVEEDAKTWSFKLRDDVLFHNGDKLTGEDVAASLSRASQQSIFKNYLSGASINNIDKNTVQIILTEPMADLLDLIADIPIAPATELKTSFKEHVGSGPYQLIEKGNELVMEVFSKHWRGKQGPERIIWLQEPDLCKRVDALLSGEADIASEIKPKEARLIENSSRADVLAWKSSVCIVFMFNTLSGVCTDRKVRRALNYALDKKKIIDEVLDGAAYPLNGPLTPSHFGYNPETPVYPYDPIKARSLLSKAGYDKGLEVVLDTRPVLPEEGPLLAKIIAEEFTKVGISTEIKEFDRATYDKMVQGKHIDDACIFDSTPMSTFRLLQEKINSRVQGPWWQGYSNREVESLIDKAQTVIDDTKRQKIYRQAYQIIRDDAAWIFLYNPLYFWGMGPKARNSSINIRGVIRMQTKKC